MNLIEKHSSGVTSSIEPIIMAEIIKDSGTDQCNMTGSIRQNDSAEDFDI